MVILQMTKMHRMGSLLFSWHMVSNKEDDVPHTSKGHSHPELWTHLLILLLSS